MTKLVLAAALCVSIAAPLAAQSPQEVEREPLVKIQTGETPVDGECLTAQELDLLARLEALTRPTVGVEGVPGIDDGIGDDPMPFDPHYFIGMWKIEGVVPESALGEGGEFAGTETVRHLSGCTYESTIEATLPTGPLTVTSRMFYDRRLVYLVRLEDDSRGFEFLKAGRVGGDPGRVLLAPLADARVREPGRTGAVERPHLHDLPLRLPDPAAHLRGRRPVHQLRDRLVGARGRAGTVA